MTFTGLWLSFALVDLLGIGLASGIATTPTWAEAYGISSGALIVAGYGGLRGFGKFCAVIVAFGFVRIVFQGPILLLSDVRLWDDMGRQCHDMYGPV